MASVFDVLLAGTEGDAWSMSLPNVKGEGREGKHASRDQARHDTFVRRHDKDGYGVFFCVSNIIHGQPRKKEYAKSLPWLFADVDFKDHPDKTPEQIETILRNLPCPPSRMHHTGNGIHCFWYMRIPFSTSALLDLAEILLRRIANHIGADPTVAHRVALLRVPGSHNTKRGERRLVRVIKEGQEVYTPEEITAWLDAARDPVMVRAGHEANPFLRIAQEQAFRAPVDVEARLAAMSLSGEGDSGVHQTQLSCTASLMAAGVDEDDAVQVVLEATQALPGTEDWNWREEERNVRAMCQDYHKKFGPKRTDTTRDITAALRPLVQERPRADGVISLADARKERGKTDEERMEAQGTAKERASEKLSKKKKNEHVIIGMGILQSLDDAGQQLMYTADQCWLYDRGLWTMMDERREKAWASIHVEHGCNALGLVSTTKIVNETRAWLQRNPTLHQKKVDWDAHGLIAMQNGMLDWQTGEFTPLEPEDYCTRVVECGYVPDARCPVWEKMLSEDYGFDAETISFLQELLGAALVSEKPRTLKRALVMLGPSNTGKSNILNVMAGLLCSTAPNATPLESLEGTHGLMSFLQPLPWVLHEAFEQGRWEMSATVKALLSSDVVNVNIKNGAIVPLVFKQPVFWGTNVPPQFREASRAMENRLAIVKMHRAFNPGRVVGTALQAVEGGFNNPAELVLNHEKSGLLNWAVVGLKRAMARGHFLFTTEMNNALMAMRLDSNIASGFIAECADLDPDSYVVSGDFYGAFQVWYRDHRGGQPPSADGFGRAMSSLSDPRVLAGHRINRKRIYAGVRLNQEGLDCWNAHSMSAQAERSGIRISGTDSEVNKVLNGETLALPVFVAMQEAHRTWSPDSQE